MMPVWGDNRTLCHHPRSDGDGAVDSDPREEEVDDMCARMGIPWGDPDSSLSSTSSLAVSGDQYERQRAAGLLFPGESFVCCTCVPGQCCTPLPGWYTMQWTSPDTRDVSVKSLRKYMTRAFAARESVDCYFVRRVSSGGDTSPAAGVACYCLALVRLGPRGDAGPMGMTHEEFRSLTGYGYKPNNGSGCLEERSQLTSSRGKRKRRQPLLSFDLKPVFDCKEHTRDLFYWWLSSSRMDNEAVAWPDSDRMVNVICQEMVGNALRSWIRVPLEIE